MKEKYVFSFISNTISYVFFILSNYIMALKFAPSLLGSWVFVNSVINLGFMFLSVGFDKIHYQYSSRTEEPYYYFGAYLLIKSVLLTSNIFISLIIITLLNLWISPYSVLLVLLLLSKTLFEFGLIFILNFRSNRKIFKAEIPFLFAYIAKSLIKIIVALSIDKVLDPLLNLVVLYIIFDIIYLFIILLLSRSQFSIQTPDKTILTSYLKDAKLLILLSVFSVIATNLGNVLLDYSLGHEILSYFSLVYVYLIPALIKVSESLFNVSLAHFSQFFQKNDTDSIKSSIHSLEKYSSILFLSLVLIVFINGNYILSKLLPAYTQSYPILLIMIFIPFLIGTSRPYMGQLISGKKQDMYAKIEITTQCLIIFSVFMTILFNFMAFGNPILDVFGYAFSQTIPWIIWAILGRYYCNKYFDIPSKRMVVWHSLIAVLTFFISLFVKYVVLYNVFQSTFYVNIISFFQNLLTFFALLWITKLIDKNDIKFFVQLLNYKNYLRSIREEFEE